jgi:cell division septum initiation protein DivIVA
VTAELVPLRTGFDVVWLGFRRDQVWHYVHQAERDIETLTADLDAAEARAEALARHLESEREDNRALRERLDRLRAVPQSPYAVGERLRYVVERTLAQAAEITDRATALEDHAWESARRTHAEHRELLAETRVRMARILREGEAGRRALDEAAARHRAEVTEDFELALALRRKQTCHDVRLMEETARRRAESLVREATRRAELINEHRDHVSDVLRVVHSLLGEAAARVRVAGPAR